MDPSCILNLPTLLAGAARPTIKSRDGYEAGMASGVRRDRDRSLETPSSRQRPSRSSITRGEMWSFIDVHNDKRDRHRRRHSGAQ
ncbi:hypothetical protein FKP32DRAFT_1589209 [Trametes sanguinea]|nr:hypothetical protein FKP32DRAFT_1589209 [Trametes sanguinea]